MWLYRGAQSAVFYYATCTPCAEGVDRRKRKKDAVRARREREKCTEVVTDQPRPFPQPTPFSTNAGWREEISLGPGPPARRGGLRNNNHRTDSWHTDQSSQLKKDKSGGLMHPLGEKWKSMRYQREDEPLWGQEVQGSSIGFSGRGRADPNETSKYYIARVPPVNDLHPPIVSGPCSRAETRWMLQPPPSARVMAGKESFNVPARDSIGGTTREQCSEATKNVVKEETKKSGDGPSDTIDEELPRHPSLTRLRVENDDFDLTLHSRSDSMFSDNTDDRSPSMDWKYPETPKSRPQSKATDDYDKVYRPQISKTLSTMHKDNKNIHLLHLEINDHDRDEVGLGSLQPIRPWRWSMDI